MHVSVVKKLVTRCCLERVIGETLLKAENQPFCLSHFINFSVITLLFLSQGSDQHAPYLVLFISND